MTIVTDNRLQPSLSCRDGRLSTVIPIGDDELKRASLGSNGTVTSGLYLFRYRPAQGLTRHDCHCVHVFLVN
jgi:hypothetical protein